MQAPPHLKSTDHPRTFYGFCVLSSINPAPQTIMRALNGRGTATIRRVSIFTVCPCICKSCRCAGITIFGRISAPIPRITSTTPPAMNSFDLMSENFALACSVNADALCGDPVTSPSVEVFRSSNQARRYSLQDVGSVVLRDNRSSTFALAIRWRRLIESGLLPGF